MLKKIIALTLSLVLIAGTSFADSTPDSIIKGAISMLEEISSEGDVSTMADTVKTSHAIAIVPSMVKAGFIKREVVRSQLLQHRRRLFRTSNRCAECRSSLGRHQRKRSRSVHGQQD